MKSGRFLFGCATLLMLGDLSPGEVVISEFMAANRSALHDEDGDASDWIEIENTGESTVDLAGWFLTDKDDFRADDPASGWRLPAYQFQPGTRLVIFASGKDRRPENGEWHTNFQLAADGEYLALIRPDGTTVASSFGAQYPKQEEDISFGRGQVRRETLTFVEAETTGRLLIPKDGALGRSWTSEGFDDGEWREVSGGVGFDAAGGPTGFELVENFESLDAGPLHGQGGWTTSDSRVVVTTDPVVAENQVMEQSGDGVRAWKAISFPNGETRTLFFRVRRAGTVDISVGTSDKATPGTAFSDFEAQLNNQKDDVLKVRDGGSFDDLDRFDDGTWYDIWMEINNATDSYRVFMKGGIHGERTLLSAGGQSTFGFRNGSAGQAMETFFARTGNGTTGQWFIDDIYLAVGENAGNPTEGNGFRDLISESGNVENEMSGVSSGAYLRMPFELGLIDPLGSLTLRMRYDDGFVAYLNGTEVASANAPEAAEWESNATRGRSGEEARAWEDFDLTPFAGLLIPNARNVLAIHGLNLSGNDGDFLIVPELSAVAAGESVEHLYFDQPTPGETNGSGFLGFAGDTTFSMERGFFEEPFDVVIDSAGEGTTIIYTTDGSLPSPGNGIFSEAPVTVRIADTTPLRAMAVKDGYRPSNVDTQTYLFLSQVRKQGNAPAGYPVTWKGDNGNGFERADYEMDPEVTESDEYGPLLEEALLSIPTISLVTDQGNFFDPATGIYQNPQSKGAAWERPVSFEVIHPDGSLPNIQVNAGIRIQGGHTRLPSKNPKHSFRLSFKREFGPAKLRYELFRDDPDAAREFDQLILRGAGNQSWLHHNTFKGDNRGRAQYIRDQWAKDVQLAMGHPAARSLYAHVYINGIYWGMYNPTERGSAGFGESYLGGEKEEFHALNSGEAIDGEAARTDYQALLSLANQGLTDAARYREMGDLLDLEAFTDYMLIHQYGGNLDWDHHNWYAIRNKNGGKWYFLCWDSEFVFISPTDNVLSLDNPEDPSRIWHRLMANEEYRLLFADRVQRHLRDGGLLTPDGVTAMWDRRKDQMFEAIVAESARWGDYRRDVDPVGPPSPIPLYDRNQEWMAERSRLFETYFPVRSEIVISQYRAAGHLPTLEAPVMSVEAGRVAIGTLVEMVSPDGGDVFYTLDGSDPRVGAEAGDLALVTEGDSLRVFVPTNDELGVSWRGGAEPFDDSSWLEGAAAGFETSGNDYADLIDLDLRDLMWQNSPSCLVRVRFEIPDQATLDAVKELSLGVRYDDGFVAFINGSEVARDNAPATLTWNARGQSHPDDLAVEYQPFTLGSAAVLSLKVGENILALHAFNASAGSNDFLIDAILEAKLETSARLREGALVYEDPLMINGPVEVLARVFDGNSWSALTRSVYLTGQVASRENLVISEIMYNPDGADDTEFIEFLNIGGETIDLSGVRFSEGLDFEFPLGTQLEAGRRILGVRDPLAFSARYGPNLPVAGRFLNDNNLDNAGDRLTLLAQNGEVIHTLRYDDRAPWPEEADGEGASLVLVAPETNPDHSLPENWRAGAVRGGTPGTAEPTGFLGSVNADVDRDGVPALLEYVFGTSDLLAGDADQMIRFYEGGQISIRERESLAGIEVFVETSSDLEEWLPAGALLELQGSTEVAPGLIEKHYRWIEGNGPAFLRVRAVRP